MLRRLLGLLLFGVVATLGLVVPATSASAAPQPCGSCGTGGGSSGGYSVVATVVFSGDGAPSGGGSVSMGVPATCWWSTPSNVPSDPSQWVQWYDDSVTGLSHFGSEVAGGYYFLGPRSAWVDGAARAATDPSVRVYVATCRESADLCAMAEFTGGPQHDVSMGYGPPMQCGVTGGYGFFTGNPPPPLVDPRDLAQIARDHIDIPVPQVDRNPKVGNLGQATLVSLPTWFWVVNPDAVGGASGTRTIRAQVGAVWAEVVARTGGLTITSPAGGTSCPPTVATQAYTSGANDASGCTVSFSAASVAYPAGYPVDASTAWTATWTGSGGTGGDLEGLARNAAVYVPVAESQALVGQS